MNLENLFSLVNGAVCIVERSTRGSECFVKILLLTFRDWHKSIHFITLRAFLDSAIVQRKLKEETLLRKMKR
jgi:hypothetical protein